MAYVTGTEWVSGGSDGGVALWSQLKKKPVSVQRAAHAAPPAGGGGGGPGGCGGDCASWVSAVAYAPATDLVVRRPRMRSLPPTVHASSLSLLLYTCQVSIEYCLLRGLPLNHVDRHIL